MTRARWIIQGRLAVVTPLSIRTGQAEEAWPEGATKVELTAPPAPDGQGGEVAPIVGIELDHKGRPFVPATAIKGLVRSLLVLRGAPASDGDLLALLGDLPKAGRDEGNTTAQVGLGGAAEFLNAYLPAKTRLAHRPVIRGKTAIHEGTRTAEDGQLRHDRIVAPGTAFDLSVELLGTQAQANALLGLLALIDGQSSQSALGAGATQGEGRVRWDLTKVCMFGPKEAAQWLAGDPGKDWRDCASETRLTGTQGTAPSIHAMRLPFVIKVEGHFVVGAREIIPEAEKKKESAEEKTRQRPYRTGHADDDRVAWLPGSSLDGALRAQARRIYRTISGDHLPWDDDDTDLPAAFEDLFGSARHGSLLETEPFTCTGREIVTQEFVAIDRLSGGSADAKKFDLRAFEAPELTGALTLTLHRQANTALSGKSGMTAALSIRPSAIGLFALILKDLATGDVPLGQGTRKGYGGVAEIAFGQGGWKEALMALGAEVVTVAPRVPALSELGKSGEEALRACVAALRAEAADWAAKRKVPVTEGTEQS